MDKHIIHKDKGETFKCHFKIDGAEIKDTIVRLCLEFANNKNLFFNGILKENGDCIVEIPKLKELEEKQGTLTIEAIADSVYFKLYEAEVEIKKSIEVSMIEPPVSQETKGPQVANIQLEELSQEANKPTRPKKPSKDWQSLENDPPEYVKTTQETSELNKFSSLKDYMEKRKVSNVATD